MTIKEKLEEATMLALQGKLLNEGEIPKTKQEITLKDINDAIKEITGESLKATTNRNIKYCIVKQNIKDSDNIEKTYFNVKNVHICSIDNPIKITLYINKSETNNYQIDSYTCSIVTISSATALPIASRGAKSIQQFLSFKKDLQRYLDLYNMDNLIEFRGLINNYKKDLTQDDLNSCINKVKYMFKQKYFIDIDLDAELIQDNSEQISLFK